MSARVPPNPFGADGITFSRPVHAETLVAQLAGSPGSTDSNVVDLTRDLKARLGKRPYVVRIVRVRWEASPAVIGPRGRGAEVLVGKPFLIEPTPLVSDLSNLRLVIQSIGQIEVGELRVSEISARYTEDQLGLRPAGGGQLPSNEEAFWEVEFPVSSPGEKRRFGTVGVPNFNPTMGWTVNLVSARRRRSRDGSPGGV